MSSFGSYDVLAAARQGGHFAGHVHARALIEARLLLTALEIPRAHESSTYPTVHRSHVDTD
jgi:hypothetical protein